MPIAQAKLPNLTLPTIRSLPSIPFVGCSPGDSSSFVGEQFGNAPDLNSILTMRAVKKSLEEEIGALIEGKLPDALRPVPYDARAVRLTNEVAQVVSTMNTIVGQVVGSVTAAINYASQQLAAVNQAQAAIASVPAGARSAVDRLMIERYGRYASELNAQIARHQQTLACLG